MRLIVTILLLIQLSSAYAQPVKDYALYVGKVSGTTKSEFNKTLSGYDLGRDSALKLANITESGNLVEIRLYERPSISVETCTILYFDSSFHVKRVSKVSPGWELKYKAQAIKPVEKIKADSVFKELVKYGIFKLPAYGSYDDEGSVLTPKGLIKNGALCGVTDGVSYIIHIKIQDVYKAIYFSSNEAAQLNCYPDDDIIRRKKNIVEQLEANMRLVKNN